MMFDKGQFVELQDIIRMLILNIMQILSKGPKAKIPNRTFANGDTTRYD